MTDKKQTPSGEREVELSAEDLEQVDGAATAQLSTSSTRQPVADTQKSGRRRFDIGLLQP